MINFLRENCVLYTMNTWRTFDMNKTQKFFTNFANEINANYGIITTK